MIKTERESTVYTRFKMQINYGQLSDVTVRKVAAMADQDARPTEQNFVNATVIQPDDQTLGRGELDLAVKVGPAENAQRPADVTHVGKGVYQLWGALGTDEEYILERVGLWEVT